MRLRAIGAVLATCLSSLAPAADIGGWFSEQQRERARAASGGAAGCGEALRVARNGPGATPAFEVALCYLQADSMDLVAARAWLQRAAELGHPSAEGVAQRLRAAEAGALAGVAHCHDLGHGRQICHGGVAPAAAASK